MRPAVGWCRSLATGNPGIQTLNSRPNRLGPRQATTGSWIGRNSGTGSSENLKRDKGYWVPRTPRVGDFEDVSSSHDPQAHIYMCWDT